jgi:hypothetical protein
VFLEFLLLLRVQRLGLLLCLLLGLLLELPHLLG